MNEATELTCANCGEASTNPGQFIFDGRWVCCQACKSELADAQSYDNLAETRVAARRQATKTMKDRDAVAKPSSAVKPAPENPA